MVVHLGYSIALVGAYRHGDLGLTYPVMRGCAPLLVAMGEFLGADKTAELDRGSLPALRHIVRVPIDKDDGNWDDFVARGTNLDAVARAASGAVVHAPASADRSADRPYRQGNSW